MIPEPTATPVAKSDLVDEIWLSLQTGEGSTSDYCMGPLGLPILEGAGTDAEVRLLIRVTDPDDEYGLVLDTPGWDDREEKQRDDYIVVMRVVGLEPFSYSRVTEFGYQVTMKGHCSDWLLTKTFLSFKTRDGRNPTIYVDRSTYGPAPVHDSYRLSRWFDFGDGESNVQSIGWPKEVWNLVPYDSVWGAP
jgi:hypothetical protein